MRQLVLLKLYLLLKTHLNRRQYFFCWPPCFGFFFLITLFCFLCPRYSRRTHRIPEKTSIAACENEGKQREFSDHKKLIKTLFLKKNSIKWCKKGKKRGINPSTIERLPLIHSQTNFITLLIMLKLASF